MIRKIKKELKNCTNCGKVFVSMKGEDLCRDCLIVEEEKERKVMDYVRDHQGCPISEVAEKTGIPDSFVKNMVSKGRFYNVKRTDLYYPCQVCGKPIRNGAYCSACLSELRKETKKMADHSAIITGISNKPISKMTTIEKLDFQAELEFEKTSKGNRRFFEGILGNRDRK